MTAIFDRTHTYRYLLRREWNLFAPRVAFVMLNPSTADEVHNDPTIRRCVGFAQAWGYGSLDVVNLFAYRATCPKELKGAIDPVGKENDRYLLEAVERAEKVILAWGNWGTLQGRDHIVLKLLTQERNLFCLGVNRSGQPRHPLYLHRNTAIVSYPKEGL